MRLWQWTAICVGIFAGVQAGSAAAESKLLETRESLYNNIYIIADGDNVSMTFGQNKRYYTESSMNLKDPGALTVAYTRQMTLEAAYAPKLDRLMEIGLGGGRTISYLHGALPDTLTQAVELDPDVAALAKKYFKFAEDDKLKLTVSDGRSYLIRDTSTWDAILIDAYRGPFVPFHLLTKEFYQLVKSRLNPGGVVVQNIEPSTMLFNSAAATINSVFSSVDLYEAEGNVVAVAYDGPPINQAELLARANKAQQQHKFRYDQAKMVAGRRVLGKLSGPILTDDFAPVETLRAIEQNNQKWKETTEAPR